jgi:tyrosyl-tRNA synthetase
MTQSLFQTAFRRSHCIYTRRVFRTSAIFRRDARRSIGTKYLAKVAEAEEQWKEQSKAIRDGRQKSMLSILEERGLIHQIAGYVITICKNLL